MFNNNLLDNLGSFTVISFEIVAFTIDFGFLRKPWAEYIHPCDGATGDTEIQSTLTRREG